MQIQEDVDVYERYIPYMTFMCDALHETRIERKKVNWVTAETIKLRCLRRFVASLNQTTIYHSHYHANKHACVNKFYRYSA